MKHRAENNRTLQLTPAERERFSRQLIRCRSSLGLEEVTNRTLVGDIVEVVKMLPDSFADMIFIDPPYNLTKNYNGTRFNSRSEEEYMYFLRSWFPQVCRLLKPGGSLYLCGDWHNTAMLQQIMSEHLTILNRITWQREKGRGAKKNWKNAMEDIWFGVVDPKKYYFDAAAVKQKRRVLAPYKDKEGKPKDWTTTETGKFRLTCPSNFWDDITVPYWSMRENTDHPTQKPEKLLAKLSLASCPPEGLVFDPFLGSGTTSVTAKKLGRRYCGVEIDEEYACWAEKRLEMADLDPSIQGYSNGVFWERNTLTTQKRDRKRESALLLNDCQLQP